MLPRSMKVLLAVLLGLTALLGTSEGEFKSKFGHSISKLTGGGTIGLSFIRGAGRGGAYYSDAWVGAPANVTGGG